MTANFKENISSLTPTNAQGQEMIFSLKINLFLGMIQYAKQQGKASEYCNRIDYNRNAAYCSFRFMEKVFFIICYFCTMDFIECIDQKTNYIRNFSSLLL